MYDKYLIKEGETLEDIASRFNTSVDMILNINDMYSREYLRAGEEIIVPKNQESYFTYYTVNQGDSLYQIARKYNINPSLLALLNGLNMEDYIYPNQRLIIPKSGYSFYITKEGYIYRGRSICYVGAHCYNHNYNSVGICFEGNFDIDYLTDDQIFSYQQLIAYLFQELPSITDVKFHRDFNATACPGKHITLDKLTACPEVFKKKMITDINEAVTILKNKLLLEEQTINFLQAYKYGEQLILKIANAVKE